MAGLALLALALGCPAQRPRDSATDGAARTGANAELQPGAPQYMVTVLPLRLILEPLVQGRASVSVLLPPGASAHTYEPRPSDTQAVAAADALFWIGEDFDGFAAELTARHSVELLPLLPESARLTGFSHHDHAGGVEPGHTAGAEQHQAHAEHPGHEAEEGVDPHFFTDPLAVRALLPALVAELARLDPAGAEQYSSQCCGFRRATGHAGC